MAELTPLPAWTRVLPGEFRERVVEPAWADLRLAERSGTTWTRALAARAILILECARIGLPQHFWYHGRPTRAARVGLVVVAVLMMLAMRIMYVRAHWPAGR